MIKLTRLLSVLLTAASAPLSAADAPAPTVAILMFDGVQIIDFAGPYEVFGQAGYTVHTVSRDGQAVQTAMSLRVQVDHDFAHAAKADIVVVPGGNVDAAAADEATLDWIRKQHKTARQVLSVCTGSDILASTGLLDGQSATTFHKHFDHMAQAFPKVTVVRDQRWVVAGKLVSSAGLSSGIDAALHVVSQVSGMDKARSVALHLEYDWSPDQGFVRGLMADQFMREPAQAIPFPKDTRFERRTSIGDRDHWQTEHQISSTLAPAALIELIRQAGLGDPALDVSPPTDPLQLSWQYQAKRGGQWRMSFQAFEPEAEQTDYRVVVKVDRLD